MIGEKITDTFKKALENKVKMGSILAVKGSEFPFAVHGVVETKGEAEVLADTKEGHDMAHPPVFGYNFIPAETLFGNTIITTYAAQGYTFWSRSDVMRGLYPKAYADKQAGNRTQFQQSISARYVFGTDIGDGGVLLDATGDDAVLNTLTPYVVLTTANLGVHAIRTRVDAFFAQANTAARGEGIPAAIGVETPEQRKTRLAAKAKMNAVAVIDVEAVNVGDVHELRLLDHTAILPEIRRLIVTTTSEGPLKIANNFLSDCTGLTSLDLSPLKNVTTIGDGFLSHCSGLTSLDLSSLSEVTRIGPSFLAYCSGLRTIKGFSHWKNISIIRGDFLRVTDAVSITPDFSGAPVPSLGRLRLGGEAAVTEIKRVVAAAQAVRSAHGTAGGVGVGVGAGTGAGV
jgi:hypothetical protein